MDYLQSLNARQREAVECGEGPALIVAGPGSGKTRVLACRFAHLVLQAGIAPRQILAVTFTNKAAREMRERIERLLAAADGGDGRERGLRHLSIGTFHSLCARWLRRDGEAVGLPRDYVIFDGDDSERTVKQALLDCNLNIKQYSPGAVQSAISRAKNEMLSPERFPNLTPFERAAGKAYRRYQELLAASRAADFDDLLLLAVRLFREHPEILGRYQERYLHILVDEFQDTNEVQYALVKLLAERGRNLYVVGDADQSIYRWRGADYRNVQRFREDFSGARTILLEENYRSVQNVLDAAMGVIRVNRGRVDKKLFTRRGAGRKLVLREAYDEHDEARFVVETISELTAQMPGEGERTLRPGDCAVMYRTNAQSRALEEEFIRANLPYRLVGAQRFYGRREVKDALAYLRLVHNPADAVSLARAINTPTRGIGDKAFAALQEAAARGGRQPGTLLLAMADAAATARLAALLPPRAAPAFAAFGRMLADWRAAAGKDTVPELLRRILRDIRYREFLRNGSEEGDERWENVEQLIAVAEEFEEIPLDRFLEEIALVSDQDTLTEAQDAPVLLTLHAAKGLEFPVVFLVGLDDGLLPHMRSMDDPEAMAEERRLFYVGITRAMDRLYLLRAFRRSAGGGGGLMDESRFLRDIPPDLLSGEESAGRTFPFRRRIESPLRETPESGAPRESKFRSGMRIRHNRFGEGIILESRVHGGDEILTVEFESAGLKRLDADAAPIEAIE
ncbi:MAG: UvrD-helicase domain-containing protein [Anaerolineales bacterium]|nr:UvrD-helicase domain-containing protein [Anaerolineales bacterium]